MRGHGGRVITRHECLVLPSCKAHCRKGWRQEACGGEVQGSGTGSGVGWRPHFQGDPSLWGCYSRTCGDEM